MKSINLPGLNRILRGVAFIVTVIPVVVSAYEIEGEWRQGSILKGRLSTGETSLKFLGHEVPVSSSGSFVLGLGRDAPEELELTVVMTDGEKRKSSYAVVQRDYKIQRIEGVPNRTVNPAPGHYERIRKEAVLAKTARAHRRNSEDYMEPFIWPVTGPISGVYGSQRFYNGEPRRPHFGVDVARPTGTPIVAPASGLITMAHPDMFFSGGTIILDHGHGLSSSFLHLSKLLVEEGELVVQGQVIGEVGATGRVTGPHLDWRMNWLDQRVDPTTLVPPMSEVLKQKEQGEDMLPRSGSN